MSEKTAVRNLPTGTKQKYRDLAARLSVGSPRTISMNSLYVKAMVEYLARQEVPK